MVLIMIQIVPVPEKSDVVFVGWKNENTSTIVSSIPSIEGDSESVVAN